jgi:hypothetical protein
MRGTSTAGLVWRDNCRFGWKGEENWLEVKSQKSKVETASVPEYQGPSCACDPLSGGYALSGLARLGVSGSVLFINELLAIFTLVNPPFPIGHDLHRLPHGCQVTVTSRAAPIRRTPRYRRPVRCVPPRIGPRFQGLASVDVALLKVIDRLTRILLRHKPSVHDLSVSVNAVSSVSKRLPEAPSSSFPLESRSLFAQHVKAALKIIDRVPT